MENAVNPEEIQGFLRDYRNSVYGHGPARPYSGYESTPRWAPSATRQGVLLLDSYSEIDDDGDARTEYTATPTVTSQGTRSSAAPSSLFSRRDAPSSVGQSTAPSVGIPWQTFLQQFPVPGGGSANSNPTATGPLHGGGDHLWCEFSELQNCRAIFRLDEEEAWIDHHAQHLRDNFPPQLVCWFCDHVPFVATAARAPSYYSSPRDHLAAAAAAAAAANFELRMRHVRQHIFDDPRLTSEDCRPDFFMIEHLFQNGLLAEEDYMHAKAYNELPENFRLPGDSSRAQWPSSSSSRGPLGLHSSSNGGREWDRERERGCYQYHDLERERRRRGKEVVRRGRERDKRERDSRPLVLFGG
ncbi:hypothetical protein VTK26DRAFT_468 [Humicola hyalothermophila]